MITECFRPYFDTEFVYEHHLNFSGFINKLNSRIGFTDVINYYHLNFKLQFINKKLLLYS